MNKKLERNLAGAIRQILTVGITVSPLMAMPVMAQTDNTSANDAVVAAAQAARAAADAAKAAAEAAMVAAQAARAAVEAANGLPPSAVAAPSLSSAPATPALPAAQPASLEEIQLAGQPAVAPVATVSAGPKAQAVLSRGVAGLSGARIISRAEIDASGQTLLSEFVRDLAENTNGSFRQSSGSLAQSQSTVSLRGLGATNSLVLINGERFAGSPTFAAGSAANLNVIPMAAVERIEVLADGATALYGDAAIGGVINIVMKTQMDGLTVSGTVGRPTREGGDERAASVMGSISNDRGQISFALDHAEQDIIFRGDRDYSAVGLSSFGFPGSFFASGPNGESLGTFPDPRCPTELGADEEYPASTLLGGRCRYNYAGVSANEASLERNSLFVHGDFEVNQSMNAFGRAIYSRTKSFGRYAPTPFVGGNPFLPTMSANNPNNPTNPANTTDSSGNDLTPFHNLGGLTGPFDLSIFYRNVPGGFRDTFIDGQLLDVIGGITAESDLLGGLSLDVVAQHSSQTSDEEATGLGSRVALQNAIDDGSFDVFGVNGPTDPAVAQTFTRTGRINAETSRDSVRAEVGVDTLKLGAFSLPLRAGVQTTRERYDIDYDAQQNAGVLDGSAGGTDIGGSRSFTSVYGGATLNLGQRAQFDAQIRADDYDIQGNTTSQRFAASFAAAPGVSLHASYANGFRAPTLAQLNAPLATSFNNAIDVSRCAESIPAAVNPDGSINASNIPGDTPPGNPCLGTQYRNLVGGNPELAMETSESWSAGVLLDSADELSLAITAYHTLIEGQVSTIPLQQTLANEFVNGSSPQVERNDDGTINTIFNNNQNIASTKTWGVTLDAIAGAYRSGLGPGARLSAVYIGDLEREQAPGQGFEEPAGIFQPNVRANLDLLWRFTNAIELNLNGNYIGPTEFPDQAAALDSWLTWDAQVQVDFPWQGVLAVGARNLLDSDPPTDPNLGSPFYRNSLHNPYGIVPYVRYTQEL